MNPDGSDVTRLTDSAGVNKNPTWSADGDRIAFQSDRDGNLEIYAIDADGSHLARVTDDPAVDADPVWSPAP